MQIFDFGSGKAIWSSAPGLCKAIGARFVTGGNAVAVGGFRVVSFDIAQGVAQNFLHVENNSVMSCDVDESGSTLAFTAGVKINLLCC